MTWRHGDQLSAPVEGDRFAGVDPLLVVVVQEAAELNRKILGRNVEQKLRERNSEDPIPQFLSNEKPENFERGFKPERSSHDEDFFESRRIAAF